MNRYSIRSKTKLGTCHAIIVETLENVLVEVDNTILCGVRTRDEQDEAVRSGHSKLEWPHSQHNVLMPDGKSMAVDAAIYHKELPHIRWDGRIETFGEHSMFAGYVMSEGARVLRKHKLEDKFYFRWGGDWNRDKDLRNNRFDDMVHFELVERK